MSERIEIQGKTLEEAKMNAASALDISVDDLQYEIIENATSGIFGIGAKQCKIAAWKEGKGAVEAAEGFLNKILPLMSVRGTAKAQLKEEMLEVEVSGENMGVVIGKRGETLDALQYLTSIVVNNESNDYVRVSLDTENYRQKRTVALEKLANKVADKVVRNGRSVTLEPMNSFERRVIHSSLQNNHDVVTVSVGEEPQRKVVVSLEKKNK
ncbi:MAG: protein jag [Clostridia bacterium]|nr:protein jag [Clostridia bacterium]